MTAPARKMPLLDAPRADARHGWTRASSFAHEGHVPLRAGGLSGTSPFPLSVPLFLRLTLLILWLVWFCLLPVRCMGGQVHPQASGPLRGDGGTHGSGGFDGRSEGLRERPVDFGSFPSGSVSFKRPDKSRGLVKGRVEFVDRFSDGISSSGFASGYGGAAVRGSTGGGVDGCRLVDRFPWNLCLTRSR